MNGLIVFDLDGTLIDSGADIAAAVNRTRGELGLAALPEEKILTFVGNGLRRLMERALADAPTVDLDAACAIQRRNYREHATDRTRLYSGVREGLRVLHEAGWKLAVFSNKPGEIGREILKFLGVDGLFCGIIGDNDGYELKPDAAAVRRLLSLSGCAASSSWLVGDNYTDLECAANAGVRSAFLTSGIGSRAGRASDLSCADFAELVRELMRFPA